MGYSLHGNSLVTRAMRHVTRTDALTAPFARHFSAFAATGSHEGVRAARVPSSRLAAACVLSRFAHTGLFTFICGHRAPHARVCGLAQTNSILAPFLPIAWHALVHACGAGTVEGSGEACEYSAPYDC